MELEDQERKILHAALLNANATDASIGRDAGESGFQARRVLISLQEKGIISPYTLINQFSLGWLKVGVYFSFHNTTPKNIQKTIQELEKHQNIVSIIELFGHHQYFISINAKSLPDFEQIMSEISSDLPHLKIDESVSIRNSMTLFKRKYLNPDKIDSSFLTYNHSSSIIDLDEKSVRVLNSIIEKGGIPNGQGISADTGISLQPVLNRIKELEASGIIVGYSYNVDPKKINYIPYDLLIRTSTRSREFKKAFFDFCASHPNIVGLTETIGAWQYEVRIEIKDLSQTTLLTQELTSKFNNEIQSIETVTICKEIKYMRTPTITPKSVLPEKTSRRKRA